MKYRKKTKILQLVLTLLTIGLIIFVFSRSLKSADESSSESGTIVAMLNFISEHLGVGEIFTQNLVRKCAHLTEFAVLGLMVAATFNSYDISIKRNVIFSPIIYLTVAIIDECLQFVSPGRAPQLSDVAIDFVGGTTGMIFMIAIICLWHKYKKGRKEKYE